MCVPSSSEHQERLQASPLLTPSILECTEYVTFSMAYYVMMTLSIDSFRSLSMVILLYCFSSIQPTLYLNYFWRSFFILIAFFFVNYRISISDILNNELICSSIKFMNPTWPQLSSIPIIWLQYVQCPGIHDLNSSSAWNSIHMPRYHRHIFVACFAHFCIPTALFSTTDRVQVLVFFDACV